MGRDNKVGLDYFDLDCHMDDKIKLIEAEYGLKGFAIVVKLFQSIYSEFGYYREWTPDISLLWAAQLGGSHSGVTGSVGSVSNEGSLSGFPKNLINDVVSASIRRGIFSEELFQKYHILTSHGIQKRYLSATSKREKVKLKKEYLLISVPPNRSNVVIDSVFDGINVVSGVRNIQSIKDKSIKDKSIKDKSIKDKNTLNTSCAEPEEPPHAPPVISLILNDKTMHDVYESDIDGWKELYPAVDVIQELKKMKGWLDSNPTKRKTKRGINRFINSWLARTQDSGGSRKGQCAEYKSQTGQMLENHYSMVSEWAKKKKMEEKQNEG